MLDVALFVEVCYASCMTTRHKGLDMLRAVAALMVIFHHGFVLLTEWLGHGLVGGLISSIARCGWIGVDLFFVLSGFLISGLFFEEWKRNGDIHPGRFLIRRAFKIYPVYLAGFAIVILIQGWQGIGPSRGVVASNLFFVQNYFHVAAIESWGHTWSLAVEEHFYAVIPVLMLLMVTLSRRGASDPFRFIPLLFAIVAVAVLGLRVYDLWVNDDYRSLHETHLRVDGFLFGVLLSYYHQFHPKDFAKLGSYPWLTVCAAVALVAPNVFLPLYSRVAYMTTLNISVVFVACSMIVAVVMARPLPDARIVRLLAYLGKHSYSIYLVHCPLLVFGEGFLKTLHPAVAFSIYVPLSLGLGVLLAKLIEFPMLRIRDRLYPSRSISSSPSRQSPSRSHEDVESGRTGTRTSTQPVV